MRLHDRLDAARHTVDHLAHDALSHVSTPHLSLDRLPLDRLPLEHLKSVPDHLRSVPEQLAGKLADELPQRVRRRLPRAVRSALPRRRASRRRWMFVMAVVLVVALVMSLRRLAERFDGAVADREARTPDSGPAPAPAGRPSTPAGSDTAATDRASATDGPLLDA